MLSLPLLLLTSPACAAVPTPVLFLGDRDNYVTQGLRALEIPHEVATVGDLVRGRQSMFDYRALVLGMDIERQSLAQVAESLRGFVEHGGVILAFRTQSPDSWLPSSVRQDVAYQPGKRLVPDHPIFNTPHQLDEKALANVHGGSVYAGCYDLGEGWKPLFSTGKQQPWDKSTPADQGQHFGIVEGAWGKGRIVLVQMIPAYGWFRDSSGDRNTDSARLFENLVRYALSEAVERSKAAKPRKRPEAYVDRLEDLLRVPRGRDGLRLDDPAWEFTSKGAFTGKCDRRGVFTISPPDAPSVAGSFGQVARKVALPADASQVMLRVYQSDDYCGGTDPTMVGDRRVSSTENMKKGMRFRQVLVDGEVVHEEDVLGLNPNPAVERIQWHDITNAASGKREVSVALRMIDKQGSGEAKFLTEAFFGCVDVRTDFRRIPATGLTAAGFRAEAGAVVLRQASGTLKHTCTELPESEYLLALGLRDEAYAQSEVAIRVNGRTVQQATLSADDFRHYYLPTPKVELKTGDVIEIAATRDGEEAVAVSELAILPADLTGADAAATKRAPYYAAGPVAKHEIVALTVKEPVGAGRKNETASQAVPFAYGALKSEANVGVQDAIGTDLPVQTRVVTRWPDGSLQSAVVSFPVSVNGGAESRYVLHYGADVKATAAPAQRVQVQETAEAVIVDTGRAQFSLPRKAGNLLSEARIGGKNVLPAGQRWCAEVEDENGAVFSSADDAAASVEVAEPGPLRAIIVKRGAHRSAAGALLDYRYEYHFTAGDTGFRFFYTFSNTTVSAGVDVKRITLRLPWDSRRHTVYFSRPEGGPKLEERSGDRVETYQHQFDVGTVKGGGDDLSRAPLQLAGLFSAEGDTTLQVGLRYCRELFPKRGVLDHGFTLDLAPAPLSDADIPAVAAAPAEVEGKLIGGVGYPQANARPGMYRVAIGESLTHELWIDFANAGTQLDADAMRARLNPVRAVADPVYVAGTKAFAEFHPRDPELFPEYEEGIEHEYAVFMKRRNDRRQYGLENFGDDTFEWGYGPVYTFWSNEEDDRTHGMLIEYLRSGDWRWWELGEQAARHYRDVDCVLTAPDQPDLVGGPRHHNNNHFVSTGWVADHTVSGAYTGHSWIEGLIDYWLMTGDLLAGEACHRMGEWYVRQVESARFGAGGQERGLGWTHTGLTSIYRATWDKRYLDAAMEVQQWIFETQDPVRGVISVPISEQPSYEGGTTFMHGIVGHGIARLYDVSHDPRVLRSLEGIANWIVTEPMDPDKPGTFWYKQAPSCKRSYGYNTKAMAATSYVYRMTGDDYMGQITDEIVRHTRPDIRSMPFYCSTLAHVAGYRQALGGQRDGNG